MNPSNNIIKQSLKTSVVNYIGIVLGAVFTLYISPRFLSTEYNGLYRLLVEYATVAGAYFHFGMPTIVNKYFYRIFDGSGRSTKGFDFIVVLVPIIAIAILGVLLALFRRQVAGFLASAKDYDLIFRYILYIIPLIVTNAYSLLIEAYTAMLGSIVEVNFYRNVLVKLFNIASVVVYAWTLNFTLTLVIIVVGSLLSTALSLVNLGRLKHWIFDLRPSLEFLRVRGLVSDFFKYAAYLVVGNLTLFLVTKIDVFFVGKLTNLSEVAYYTTAMFFIVFISVPYQAVLNISFPHVSKAFVSGNMTEIRTTLTNNALFGFTMALFIGLAMWINIDFVYTVMPKGDLYSAGKYVFLILAVGKIIDTSIGSLGQLITVSKWYVFSLYFSVFISVVSLTLAYFMTIEWGIYGTATAVAICNVINVGYQLVLARCKLKVTPYDRKFLYVLLLIIPVCGISFLADWLVGNIWVSAVLKTVLSVIIFFGTIYRFRLSSEITVVIDRLVRK